MPTLNPAPAHKSVNSYHAALDRFARLGVTRGIAVQSAIASLHWSHHL